MTKHPYFGIGNGGEINPQFPDGDAIGDGGTVNIRSTDTMVDSGTQI